MSLFQIIPQETILQFYCKAFDFIILSFVTLPQISAKLWSIYSQKANKNNWYNTDSIFKELLPNFKAQICTNENKCNYLGIYFYIYIYLSKIAYLHIHRLERYISYKAQ